MTLRHDTIRGMDYESILDNTHALVQSIRLSGSSGQPGKAYVHTYAVIGVSVVWVQ